MVIWKQTIELSINKLFLKEINNEEKSLLAFWSLEDSK